LLYLKSKNTIVETVIVVVVVRIRVIVAALIVLVGGLLVGIQLGHIDLPSQGSTDATKALDELRPLGGSIRDELEIAPEALVVFGEPFHQRHLVDRFQLDSRNFVAEEFVVSLLLFREVQDGFFPRLDVSDLVALDFEVVPDYQVFDGSHFESLEGVIDHEAEASGVLGDVVKVLLQEFLFLHKLDADQRIGTELDGLIESVLATVTDIDHLDDDFVEAHVEEIGPHELGLEVGRTGQDDTLDVGFAPVGDKELCREFRDLANVVVPLFETQTGEPQGGLSTAAVLLGQIDAEFVENFLGGSLDGSVETSVTVHDDKAKGLVVHEKFIEILRVELVVAEIQGRVDGSEGFEVDVDLAFFPVFGDDGPAVHDQSVGRALVVEFQALLRGGDGAQDTQSIDARLDIGGGSVFVAEHFVDAGNLVTGGDDERDHRRSVSSGGLQVFDEFLHLEDLDLLVHFILGFIFLASHFESVLFCSVLLCSALLCSVLFVVD